MIKIIDDVNSLPDDIKIFYEIAENVFNQLGTGHTEFIYHRAMEIELRTNNYIYETERRVLIMYKDKNDRKYILGEERIDLYIHNLDVLIELKAIITNPKETEISQIYKYHRGLQNEGLNPKYGIIINFPQAGIKTAKDKIDFYFIVF